MRRRSPITLVCAAWLALVGLPFVSAVCQACMTESCMMGGSVSEDSVSEGSVSEQTAPTDAIADETNATDSPANTSASTMPPCHAAMEQHEASATTTNEPMPRPADDAFMACCYDDPGVVEALSSLTVRGPASVDAPLALQALGAPTTTDRTATAAARQARPPGASPPLFTLHASLLI